MVKDAVFDNINLCKPRVGLVHNSTVTIVSCMNYLTLMSHDNKFHT